MPDIVRSIIIPVSSHKVFELIKDMEAFPSFMRDVKSVVVSNKEVGKMTTRWEIDIDGAPIKWTELDIIDDNAQTIAFSSVKGDYRYDGLWKAESLHDGKTKLTLECRFNWEMPNFEKYFGKTLKNKACLSLRSMLLAVKRKLTNG